LIDLYLIRIRLCLIGRFYLEISRFLSLIIMIDKEKILKEARNHLTNVRVSIQSEFEKLKKTLKLSEKRFAGLSYADQMVERVILANGKKRIVELDHLEGSPYFVRCDILFPNDTGVSEIYFGKFGFSDESIYSWVTPASVVRFEKPGDVSFKRPDGVIQKAKLIRKDQYMITDGKIKFLSSESIGLSRKLIYEEYFSTKKTSFILPEIVSQMEQAQDQVIRAHHLGPFLISGPAGSGKTTLALHRVAYLVQSPDLAETYVSKSVIIFVQDEGTKEYFSHLLPELGIDDVEITTFQKWAFSILGIRGNFVERYGDLEYEKDSYEFQKLEALRNFIGNVNLSYNNFSVLENLYAKYFNEKQKVLFQSQKLKNAYDRIDLTLLLKIFYKNNKELSVVKDYYVLQKNGKLKKKRGPVSLRYSLAVIDEFQNYMSDQLKLIKLCINEKTQSIIYVGDMKQQVKMGTISNWEDVNEKMDKKRKVVLEKIYRNTKNILGYIRSIGYDVEIPAQLKDGLEVREYACQTKEQEIGRIKKLLKNKKYNSVGILSRDEKYLAYFKREFSENEKIHVMTMNESQGVEFDIVFLVGIGGDMFTSYADENISLANEKRKINQDLLYVALTRAMSELYVMGQKKLSKIDKI